MPVIDYQDVLKGLLVQEAMRRQVIQLPETASLEQAISYTIKYKVNAILITAATQEGLGVVSKTDLMGAYYAGLPLSTACETVMVGPPLFCRASGYSGLCPGYYAGQQGAPSLCPGALAPTGQWVCWLIPISWVYFTGIATDARGA